LIDNNDDHDSGAGIIGQPYAFKQAGLLTGIILLIILTIIVDWTIRLLVKNSKLSGKSSFQTTVQHCFGNTGLIAISLAQWALYVLYPLLKHKKEILMELVIAHLVA